MSLENAYGVLLVKESNGSTELIGLHWMAVVVLVVLILILYPSIAKLLAAAPAPASSQPFASLKAVGRVARPQGFAGGFDPSNNRYLTSTSGLGQQFLGVPEAPNFSSNPAVDQNLLDVTLDAIKVEGGSGLGSLGDLAKADMVASAAADAAASASQKFAGSPFKPLGI